MNTADRSIALVDYALRRRFKFVALNAFEHGDAPVLRRWLKAKAVSDVDSIVELFCKLNELVSRINPHFVIGHSYFMIRSLLSRTKDMKPERFPESALRSIWQFSILPLLSEYEPHRSVADLEKDYGLAVLRAA